MSKLREAAQQVLEWLDQESWPGLDEWVQEGRAIRASLRAALAEPVQEPVAWLYRDHNGQLRLNEIKPKPYFAFPVYTAPPQRRPLTQEEAWDMWDALADRGKKGEDVVFAFVRSVERAHGIGGQDE